MNICFICAEYPPVPHGGAGTFTQVMARALARSGHQVRVIGLYGPRLAYAEREDDRGVSVWRLKTPSFRGGWVFGRIALYRMVTRWIAEGHVDVVDAPDHEGPFAGWPRVGVPLVQRAGGSYSYFLAELGRPIAQKTFRLERSSYRRVDAWIAKSEYIGRKTKALFDLQEGPHATLYNPVDVPLLAPALEDRSKQDVVFTGTLTEKKGVLSLVDAWPAILERVPNATLHLFGKDGVSAAGTPMAEHLRSRLPSHVARGLCFYGHVHRGRIAQALSKARVAVFPSYAEGFAWAPLEAMAAGCPTIYSRTGSGPELISHGKDGLLVDPGNPADIALAVTSVLSDDGLARRLGRAGRARVVDAFSLEKLQPANESFYARVIEHFGDRQAQTHARARHRAA